MEQTVEETKYETVFRKLITKYGNKWLNRVSGEVVIVAYSDAVKKLGEKYSHWNNFVVNYFCYIIRLCFRILFLEVLKENIFRCKSEVTE